jgi:hypothetical protein
MHQMLASRRAEGAPPRACVSTASMTWRTRSGSRSRKWSRTRLPHRPRPAEPYQRPRGSRPATGGRQPVTTERGTRTPRLSRGLSRGLVVRRKVLQIPLEHPLGNAFLDRVRKFDSCRGHCPTGATSAADTRPRTPRGERCRGHLERPAGRSVRLLPGHSPRGPCAWRAYAATW